MLEWFIFDQNSDSMGYVSVGNRFPVMTKPLLAILLLLPLSVSAGIVDNKAKVSTRRIR